MRLVRRSGCRLGLGAIALTAALLGLTGGAEAAFPGRDGLLAVQPLSGSGIVLVGANGGSEARVCAHPVGATDFNPPLSPEQCGLAAPKWSPDGRTLVAQATENTFESQTGITSVVMYPDGSCMACQPPALVDEGEQAFTQDPTLFTSVVASVVARPSGPRAPPSLVEFGTDGFPRRSLMQGPISDPVWSSIGELALVRSGWIWVGSPGKLRRLTPGSMPSWSPDGRRIVFSDRGWLTIVRLRGDKLRRLLKGTAPSWSPNGRWIAFFDKRHRLRLVRSRGGPARTVGHVKGRTVDWQPLPARTPTACLAPRGYKVIASDDVSILSFGEAVSSYLPGVSTIPVWAALGCLRADGRERLLDYAVTPFEHVVQYRIAGPHAALVISGADGIASSEIVDAFNVGTGAAQAAQSTFCYSPCTDAADQLVLGGDGVSAVHITEVDNQCTCTLEQIQAADGTGTHTLDSVTEPDGSLRALTNLTLTGDMLTWDHSGNQRTAQLRP